jgi:hypothetical protein
MCGANLSNDAQNQSQANMNQQCQSPQLQQSYNNSMQNQAQGNKGGYGGLGLIKLIGKICISIIGLLKFTIRTVRTLFFIAKVLIIVLIVYWILKLFGFVHTDLLSIDKLSSFYTGFISKIMSGMGDFIKSLIK